MKVPLTGGSGNLGQALVPRLLAKGDTPIILDVRAPPSLNDGARSPRGPFWTARS
jgi:uncharacterized protein YbjT (DUF2867 family)